MTMLDAIGPYEVLRNIEKAEVFLVAENKGVITADYGFADLIAKYVINELKNAEM